MRQIYYILRYFGLLHFASIVITFWVIEFITFCVESYYILGHYYILRQKLLHFGLLLHFGSIITFCGVTAHVQHCPEEDNTCECIHTLNFIALLHTNISLNNSGV